MERSGVAYATPLFSQKEGTHIKKLMIAESLRKNSCNHQLAKQVELLPAGKRCQSTAGGCVSGSNLIFPIDIRDRFLAITIPIPDF
jgi:hypothetical protein